MLIGEPNPAYRMYWHNNPDSVIRTESTMQKIRVNFRNSKVLVKISANAQTCHQEGQCHKDSLPTHQIAIGKNWTGQFFLPPAFIPVNCTSLLRVKVKESRNRPGVAQRVPGGLGSQISWHSTNEGGEVVSLAHRPPLPPGIFLVLIFTRGWVDLRAMVRSEGNTCMSLKNPVTPPEIDPGTVRLVAQCLNPYSTPGPIPAESVNNKLWNIQLIFNKILLCR